MELIHDGVPATAIDLHGYGETHLLVATGPNAREPQNRPVEIVLKYMRSLVSLFSDQDDAKCPMTILHFDAAIAALKCAVCLFRHPIG